MAATPWLLIGIGILIILLAVLFLLGRKINKRPPDYYNFFIFGIIWVPLGLLFNNNVLWMLGLVFLIAGLANKDKWEKNRIRWDDLTAEEKKFRKIVIGILTLTLLIGVAAFYMLS
ncbi:hypothetical protein GQ473_02625 [archaeon]|nr:hypothetical protein [archaeon]